MKALTKKTKILLIVIAVAVLLLLAAVMLFMPSLIAPALWSLLILGVGFLVLELWSRRKKKNKQRAFDEKVAAKEGIEDRKREWAGWIEELDRQGIDRYELPFYMIVGEPQSGKSVLLQNSDLYFPFGQERLSGVGGTRGCDWWFTDEAVILDIAGRLFTHEGGVADKLEWEAFLDQLNGFRPLCPANGVLLVVPCDALLEDTPAVCADKANKIQSALLTLTQKLQAKLPVYLVLTKGDRIFGFAESVHRLDPEERHQMFGWSREADKGEKQFALDEAKAGFQALVGRAQLLRERMVASARLPEALPEIDRLYAFPDELAGMYPALEIYLKRIFGESSLVDRASFRGIYLTSGLQTGAPIARVCAQLLGDAREADARALESLFSHQRAYFIKDLVKRRVFAERGLVRPTEGRVLAARRNAMIGYGAAATLALAAVVGSAWHLLQGRDAAEVTVFENAIAHGSHAVDSREVAPLLRDLHAIRVAVELPREVMQEVFRSTRDGFEALYAKVCDRALAPALRAAIETNLLERAQAGPADFAALQRLAADARTMLGEVDFAAGKSIEMAERVLGKVAVDVTDGAGRQVTFTLGDALRARTGSGSPLSQPKGNERLGPLAMRMTELVEGVLDPANAWVADGALGYMTAWWQADSANGGLEQAARVRDKDMIVLADRFDAACKLLNRTGTEAQRSSKGVVTRRAFVAQLRDLAAALLVFQKAAGRVAADADTATWELSDGLLSFALPRFTGKSSNDNFHINIGSGTALRKVLAAQDSLQNDLTAEITVLQSDIYMLHDQKSSTAMACATAPHVGWTIRSIAGVIGQSWRKYGDVYDAKVEVMAQQFATRFPTWEAVSGDFHSGDRAPAADVLDLDLLATLVGIRADLAATNSVGPAVVQHLSRLVASHLRAVQQAWGQRANWPAAYDITIPKALLQIARDTVGGEPVGIASQLWGQYVGHYEDSLLLEWAGLPQGSESTMRIAQAFDQHIAMLDELERAVDPNAPITLDDVAHQAWLGKADAEFAGRVNGHVDALTAFWRPDTKGFVDVGTAVEGVRRALLPATLSQKVDSARRKDQIDSPRFDATELRGDGWIAKKMPQSAKALVALRGFAVPTEGALSTHAIAKTLKSLVDKIDADLAQDNGKGLAATATALAPLPAVAPEVGMQTVDHYLRPLHEGLSRCLVADVRHRYVQALSRVVFKSDASDQSGRTLVGALYPESLTGNVELEDATVVARLAGLLDPEGQLEALQRDYKMTATGGLRPGDDDRAVADLEWWDFERFLGGLKLFLTGGGKHKVADAAFFVRLGIPPRQEGVWDIKLNGNKAYFYYPLFAARPGFHYAFYGQKWDQPAKPLDWTLQTSNRPTLWFLWTGQPRESMPWPTTDPADASYGVQGCLAPLVFAWSGSLVDGKWDVQFAPGGTNEKARLVVSFQDKDADLTLPRRPARPSPL